MVKRKWIRGFAALLCLLLLLPLASLAESAESRVTDDAGLFTEAEIAQMEEQIAAFRNKYQMDCAVLTTRSVSANRDYDKMEQTVAYADKYYEDHGYGMGEDRAGILYMIDMKNRVSYVSTAGVMIDYITDKRKEELLSSADDSLAKGRYGRAALALLKTLASIVSRGLTEGRFRYDDVTGERLTGLYNRLTTGELILAGGVGIGAAAILLLTVIARYKLKRTTYRFNKATQSSVSLSRDEKIFLNSRVTRTRISSGGGGRMGGGGGGGSGVHISSGGMSHGGGGHHF